MTKTAAFLAGLLGLVAGRVSAQDVAKVGAPGTIVCPVAADPQVKLAAHELRRYLYLRTGRLLSVAAEAQAGTPSIVFATDDALPQDAYALRGDSGRLVISGATPTGQLYGAYALAEKFGVRFYLHGDVVPDGKVPFSLPKIDETHRPIFALRGIQPFHDFPDGPDWWNRDDYLSVVSQLAKMRMNFIGLHCYPYRWDNGVMTGPEPLVWQGLPQDVNPDGTVKASYPAWWDTSVRRSGWPYAPLKTSEYSGGAAQLFPCDEYGPDVHTGLAPLPGTPEQCNELFNRVGSGMGDVFAFAKRVGVKTCVGTETPFIPPAALAERLKAAGKNPEDPAVVEEIYEGTFKRLQAAMPADYYWLWTPEGWNSGNFGRTKDDILAAYRALKKVGSSTTLATCGWELGPGFDRGAMDKFLPKECPMSCISSHFGHAGIIPSFADISGREKWAIPWVENDVNLIGYEPWVGRFRYDAADARRLGCTGFMGIHWHVRHLMNNFSALAQACWDQSYVPASFDTRAVTSSKGFVRGPENRTMPVADHYDDFAKANFGPEIGAEAGAILASLDGEGSRPDMSGWSTRGVVAQGCLLTNSSFHAQSAAKGAIVERLAALRPKISGAGARDRFDAEIATLRASVAMYEAGALRGDMLAVMKAINAEKDAGRRKELAGKAVGLRRAMARAFDAVMHQEILAASTPGDLGILSNLERNTLKDARWLDAWDAELETLGGAPLPADCAPAKIWSGPAMIKMFTVRTCVRAGESLDLRPVALDRTPVKSVVVKFRPLGAGEWKTLEARNLARAVFEVKLPAASEDFEYFIEAQTAGGETLRWPATAPETNQTVVVE